MYTVTLRKAFVAYHTLPNAGEQERMRHSHSYMVEITLAGEFLDEGGYLIDIDHVGRAMERTMDLFRDRMLNELPDFKDRRPSMENLAHAFWLRFTPLIGTTRVLSVEVRIWESADASASFRQRLMG